MGGSDHRCGLFMFLSISMWTKLWVGLEAGRASLSLHEHVDLSEGGRNKEVDLCTGNLSSHSL